jgi:hypothetical protein
MEVHMSTATVPPRTGWIELLARNQSPQEGEPQSHISVLVEAYSEPKWINYKSKPLQIWATIVVTACSLAPNANVQGMVTAEANRIIRDLQAEGLACEYHKAGAGQQAMHFNVRLASSMAFIWVKA